VNELRRRGEESSFRLASQKPEDTAARVMKVLIAEDDPRTIKSVTNILSELGCETFVTDSALDAIRLVEQRRPDVLLLNGSDSRIRGAAVARFVKNAYAEYRPRTIIVAATEGEREPGVDGYLMRPLAFDQIASAIFGAAQQHAA
jgi:CheY-like chemotaxis protein